MSDRLHKLLFGYLTGALDDSDRRRVERRLRSDPKWQAALAAVRESLEPLRAAKRTYAPPPGLASRTCQFVAMFGGPVPAPVAQAPAGWNRVRRRARRMSAAMVPPNSTASWSWIDLTVTAAILVVLCWLVVPAVQRNRDHARMAACQENLRQSGLSLAEYAQSHPGLLAPEAPREPFVPVDAVPTSALAAVVPAPEPSFSPPLGDMGGSQTPPGVSMLWRSVPRPGHHGFSGSAWGQNLLYGDFHVTFVASESQHPLDREPDSEQTAQVPIPMLTVLSP